MRPATSPAALRVCAVLTGGAAGALARAGTARAIPDGPDEWPWATFAVNIAGTLVLAWMTTRLDEVAAPSPYWRLLLGTGFCGALTTFSTLQVETIELARAGRPVLAVAYAMTSVAAGMAAAVVATVGVRRRRYGSWPS